MNTRLYFVALFVGLFICFGSSARTIYPDSKTASNSVELGVEGIDRICPMGLWDHWVFKEIDYDKDTNTVLWVIQSPHSLRRLDKELNLSSEEDIKKITTHIVSYVIEGYNALIKDPTVDCDGDFMAYLGLGTLLKEMEKNNSTLQIALLYPDKMNVVVKDIPMTLDYFEIKQMFESEDEE